MRFYGLALVASAAVLGACGGGENKARIRQGRCCSGCCARRSGRGRSCGWRGCQGCCHGRDARRSR